MQTSVKKTGFYSVGATISTQQESCLFVQVFALKSNNFAHSQQTIAGLYEAKTLTLRNSDSTVQCRQCSSVQYSTLQYSSVQYTAVHCSVIQCSAVLCNAVQCYAVQCSIKQCSAVVCSAVQCYAVQCSGSTPRPRAARCPRPGATSLQQPGGGRDVMHCNVMFTAVL